jgi:hypothetical protein
MEKIENFYLNFLRIFLIIFASVAIIYSILNLFYSFHEILKNADFQQVEVPKWSELRYEVLPIAKSSKNSNNEILEQNHEPSGKQNLLFDSEYKIILTNLGDLYGENNKTLFSENLNIQYLRDLDKDIPVYSKRPFIYGLTELSGDLLQENLIKKIESPERRLKIILDSLNAYKETYEIRIQSLSSINSNEQQLIEVRNANGYNQIMFSFYGLGVFIFLLICTLVLKVEYNLRKIAPAIYKKNEN